LAASDGLIAMSEPITWKKKIFLLVAGAACLVLLIVWKSAPRQPTIAIRFTGFTNSDKVAMFSVSNANRRAIYVMQGGPQTRNSSVWSRAAIQWPGGVALPLMPHHERPLTVEVPKSASIWRVPVCWSIEPSPMDRWKGIWEQNRMAYEAGRPLPGWRVGFGMIGQTNYSEEFTNEYSPPTIDLHRLGDRNVKGQQDSP
jgi:hypothetical protein